MSRRRGRRGTVRKDNVVQTGIAGLIDGRIDVTLAEWELDGDGPATRPYDWAVATVLEALEGLWFSSDDFEIEREVNAHVQRIKQQIQETL